MACGGSGPILKSSGWLARLRLLHHAKLDAGLRQITKSTHSIRGETCMIKGRTFPRTFSLLPDQKIKQQGFTYEVLDIHA
jgi:DNA repair photolyase